MKLEQIIGPWIQSLDQSIASGEVEHRRIVAPLKYKLQKLASCSDFWPIFIRTIVTRVDSTAGPQGPGQTDHLDALGMWLSWIVGTEIGKPVPGPTLFYQCIQCFMKQCVSNNDEATQRLLINLCLVIVIFVNQVQQNKLKEDCSFLYSLKYDSHQIGRLYQNHVDLVDFLTRIALVHENAQAKIYALIALQPFLDYVSITHISMLLDPQVTTLRRLSSAQAVTSSKQIQLTILSRVTLLKILDIAIPPNWTTSTRALSHENWLYGIDHGYTTYQFAKPIQGYAAFEVQLLTLGSIRIGLSPRFVFTNDLAPLENVCCLDPYEKGLWINQKETWQPEMCQIGTRSTVSVLVDTDRKMITFTVFGLNSFSTRLEVTSGDAPTVWREMHQSEYCFTISLAAFQQCLVLTPGITSRLDVHYGQ